ncbi:hypothetical protein HCC30_06465 [Streptomyces sp. HNM0574]|nr:hypothetical protein [Streptomyces sp. HNM0574]
MIGGGALAAVVVAGIVATAVIGQGGGSEPSAGGGASPDLPSSTPGQPQPTFNDEPPPPPPPRDFIATAERDKAPLTQESLFPGDKATINGRAYKKGAVSAAKKCASGAHSGLGPVLTKNGCDGLYRATFTREDLAVTVGIAVFDDAETATKVKSQYKPNLKALPGNGVPDFCRTVSCRTTVNSLGRYAYFTISGRTDGKESTEQDKAATRAGLDGSNYAYARILQRGKLQSQEWVDAQTEKRNSG